MPKAIIFDLDGVLISSELSTFYLLQKILAKHNINLGEETYPRRIGKKIKIFLDEIYGDSVSSLVKQVILDEFYQEYIRNTEKYITPIKPTVNFIKNYYGFVKLGLASVSSRKVIDKILNQLKISSKFASTVSSDDITYHKPDPEIYYKSMEKLGLTAKDCVAIEDSLVGVQAANRAGIAVYVFLNGINDQKQFADVSIAGFLKEESDIQHLLIS